MVHFLQIILLISASTSLLLFIEFSQHPQHPVAGLMVGRRGWWRLEKEEEKEEERKDRLDYRS
jgi:hypothetical protein